MNDVNGHQIQLEETDNTRIITREMAQRVRDVVDAGLSNGLGIQEPGKMCVEAAVCYALGQPHGDDPRCVAPSLRQLKIHLNDRTWTSPASRASGLRRLAVAQLGSAGALDESAFIRHVVDLTIKRALPVGLRAAAKVNPKHAAILEAASRRCEREGTREALSEARDAAAYAASAAAAAYADAAAAAADAVYAVYAAYAGAAAAEDADAAAVYAAYAAAAADAATYAAGAATYSDAATAAATSAAYTASAAGGPPDSMLAQYAEWIVEILIDMKAPGCEYLDLVPLEGRS